MALLKVNKERACLGASFVNRLGAPTKLVRIIQALYFIIIIIYYLYTN